MISNLSNFLPISNQYESFSNSVLSDPSVLNMELKMHEPNVQFYGLFIKQIKFLTHTDTESTSNYHLGGRG